MTALHAFWDWCRRPAPAWMTLAVTWLSGVLVGVCVAILTAVR